MVELEVLTVVETSGLASESPGMLQESEREAKPHLTTNLPFRLALDIRRARISRIQPLLYTSAASISDESAVATGEVQTSEQPPGLSHRDFPEQIPAAPKQR